MLKNTDKKYGVMAQIFHWLIAIIVLAMLALGFIANRFATMPLKGDLFGVHKSLGLTLLLLMVARLVWRHMNQQPTYPASVPRWQQRAARLVHWGFYVGIIGMTIIGWVMSSLSQYGVSFWGWFNATLPLTPSKAWHHVLANWHSIAAWIICGLIVLHIAAAIKHALIDKDGVMQRML